MEAIVSKVLKKYFKLFIKNFKSDNFSMSLMKGEGTLVDLDLNEFIIQDLLMIPPQFRVTLATCDQLSAKIPWTTNFKKEPITISLQNIVINLKEPDAILPIQSQLKKFKKKTKNKRNEITENLQIEVKSIKLNIETLRGTTLMIEIENVVIQSTNSNFQPVEISQIKNVIDKESGTETLFKIITAGSISLKLQDIGGIETPLVENLPLKVLYSTKRRIKDWIQLSAKVEFVLKNLNLNWTLSQWHNIMDLVTIIQSTLARAVPVEPGTIGSTTTSSKDKKKLASLLKKKEKENILNITPTMTNIISSAGSSPRGGSPMTSRLANDTNGGNSPSQSDSSSVVTSSTVTTSTSDIPTPKHSDFTYEFHIEKCQMELVDNNSNAGNGFLFKGEGLHFGFTSANTIFKPFNPETNAAYYQIPIRETILTVIIKSLSVHEFSLSSQKKIVLCHTNENSDSRKTKKYDKSITSISSDAIPERISIHQYSGPFLLKGHLIFRKPIILSPPSSPPLLSSNGITTTTTIDSPIPISSSPIVPSTYESDPLKLILAGGPPLIGLELNLHLNDLNLNGDRRSWKSLISFLMPPEEENLTSEDEPIEEIPETTSPTINGTNSTSTDHPKKSKILIEKGKKKISKFKKQLKLGDNWKNQIKFSLKATNTELMVRDEKVDQFKGLELKINLGSLIMRNHSEWKQVPYLIDGLQLVDRTVLPEPISLSGLDHRLSFQIENISTYLIFNSNSTNVLPPQAILSPSTISLFVRISRSQLLNQREKRIPKIDVSFTSLDFNFKLTSLQSLFIDHLANKYLSPKKLKNLLSFRLKNAAKKKLKAMDNKKLDKTLTIKNKVEKTLQQYFVNCFINIKKGHFHLPLQYLLEPKEKKGIIGNLEGEINNNNTSSSCSINTITSSPLSQIEKLSEIKVELLGILFQNNKIGQNIVLKVGSIEAYGIDHPKLSTSTILRPLPIPEDEYIPSATFDNTNLLVTYSRKQKILDNTMVVLDTEFNDFITEVWVKLQGTQVRILKKPKITSDDPTNTKSTKNSKIKMPDVKNFITKAVNLLERRKDNIKDIKKGIKKVNLNLKWGVELGNCEILLGDKSKHPLIHQSDQNQNDDFHSIDENTYQPKGIIKITDTNRKSNAKSYKDMEESLLNNKLRSATSEQEKEIYTDKISLLEKELEILKAKFESEMDKKLIEYQQLEAKYIEMKLHLAELATNI